MEGARRALVNKSVNRLNGPLQSLALAPAAALSRRHFTNPTNYKETLAQTSAVNGSPDPKSKKPDLGKVLETEARASSSIKFSWFDGTLTEDLLREKSVQRSYLEWLSKKLGFSSREDWYRITARDFIANEGDWLLNRYRGSPLRALRYVYSDHKFVPWLFKSAPKGFFKLRANRKEYVEWLKTKISVSKFGDLRSHHFTANGGGGLLTQFGGSPQAVLASLESDESRPREHHRGLGYWNSLENQRVYLDSIGEKIGAQNGNFNAWYTLNRPLMKKLGFPRRLLSKYDASLYALLKRVYPEHTWVPWKFQRLPSISSKDPEIISQVLDYVEKECKVAQPEDWYSIPNSKLEELGVASLISRSGSLISVLRVHKPTYPWDESLFVGARLSGPKALALSLRRVWPERDIVESFEIPGSNLKAAYYIPSLQIAINYLPLDYFSNTPKPKLRAKLFQWESAASSSGLILVMVPFWWDKSTDSLIATILEKKPSLAETFSKAFDNKSKPTSRKPIPSFDAVFPPAKPSKTTQ